MGYVAYLTAYLAVEICKTNHQKMMIYFEVLIQASNRKTELRFMVSDSRGIRPQPGLIKYVKEKFMNNLKNIGQTLSMQLQGGLELYL